MQKTKVNIDIKAYIEEEPTHKVGNYYLCGEEVYILSRVGYSEVLLVELENGNRYTEAVNVKSPCALTKEEFNIVCGYGPLYEETVSFKLIKELEIKVIQ